MLQIQEYDNKKTKYPGSDKKPKACTKVFSYFLFATVSLKPATDKQHTFFYFQWQNLPLSHINGAGITRLDRRQLNDAIQIFSDIIKHLFPPKPDPQQQRAPEPATEPGVHASDIGKKLLNYKKPFKKKKKSVNK